MEGQVLPGDQAAYYFLPIASWGSMLSANVCAGFVCCCYGADPQGGSDVSLYLDASTAPLLDLRCRFEAVVDLLSAMIRGGVSLARSIELAVQWDGILQVGPILLLLRIFCWLGVRILVSVVRWCRVFTAGFRILSMVWLCIVGLRLFVVGGCGYGRIFLFNLTSAGTSCSLLAV